jgi:hypothetical protein
MHDPEVTEQDPVIETGFSRAYDPDLQEGESDHHLPLYDLAQEYPPFTSLAALWTEGDVETYLRSLFQNEAGIAMIRARKVNGLLTLFHELVEIDELARLVDPVHGEGYIRSRLAAGEITFDDVDILTEGEIAQYRAHDVAMRAEFNFVRFLAERRGYDSDPNALILTHPRFLEGRSEAGGTIQDVWEYLAPLFGVTAECPLQSDIARARDFWQEHGIMYSEREHALLNGETIESILPPIMDL